MMGSNKASVCRLIEAKLELFVHQSTSAYGLHNYITSTFYLLTLLAIKDVRWILGTQNLQLNNVFRSIFD